MKRKKSGPFFAKDLEKYRKINCTTVNVTKNICIPNSKKYLLGVYNNFVMDAVKIEEGGYKRCEI